MGFFKKTVTIEQQLASLSRAGLVLNAGVSESDLTTIHPRAELERKPFVGLVEVLGIEIEREPFTPICDRLWLCDFERIEDDGAYVDVVARLERMTGRVLGLVGVVDLMDVRSEKAWVEFEREGNRVHWDLGVDDDWLDPQVLVWYDALLETVGSRLRLYWNQTDYGQSALLGAFVPEEKSAFDKLTRIKLLPLAERVQ